MILELHAAPGEVMRAVDALQEFCRGLGVTEQTLSSLSLALEESGSNVVNHSLRRDSRQTFHVAFSVDGNAIVIELRDRGPEFDPTQVPFADGTVAEDDHGVGGWGIRLLRRSVDKISYVRDGNENVLRLTKRLDASDAKPPRTA